MQWASIFLWYIARQSSILSIPSEGFVSASSTLFSSLVLLMLCPKSENQAADSSRKGLLPENYFKSWYQYNWGVYGKKAFNSNTQRVLQTSAGSSCYSEITCRRKMFSVDWKWSKWLEIKIYLILIPKSLDARGLIGVKERILKQLPPSWTFVLWTPHKEHTESATRKDHLAPCRFKCWTNLYSIGISQPLAHLQRSYNVEIPCVSLHVKPFPKPIENVALSAKWNVHIWNRLRKCSSRLYTGTLKTSAVWNVPI